MIGRSRHHTTESPWIGDHHVVLILLNSAAQKRRMKRDCLTRSQIRTEHHSIEYAFPYPTTICIPFIRVRRAVGSLLLSKPSDHQIEELLYLLGNTPRDMTATRRPARLQRSGYLSLTESVAFRSARISPSSRDDGTHPDGKEQRQPQRAKVC